MPRGERPRERKAPAIEGYRRRSGGRAAKRHVLTRGDLALRLKGRRRFVRMHHRRSEESAEAVVAVNEAGGGMTPRDAGSLRSGEGPNEKESESTMSLDDKQPQMPAQAGLV